jgi:acetoin utilization deacetylase AcuC-like enzyme
VNIPLEAGATDADYAFVYREVVDPVLEQFKPQLTLVSAGFDAHESDPLASMRLTTAGYASIVGGLASVTKRHGALALVTEGGYDLTALEQCLETSLTAAEGRGGPLPPTPYASTARGERALSVVRKAQASYWAL